MLGIFYCSLKSTLWLCFDGQVCVLEMFSDSRRPSEQECYCVFVMKKRNILETSETSETSIGNNHQ